MGLWEDHSAPDDCQGNTVASLVHGVVRRLEKAQRIQEAPQGLQ